MKSIIFNFLFFIKTLNSINEIRVYVYVDVVLGSVIQNYYLIIFFTSGRIAMGILLYRKNGNTLYLYYVGTIQLTKIVSNWATFITYIMPSASDEIDNNMWCICFENKIQCIVFHMPRQTNDDPNTEINV